MIPDAVKLSDEFAKHASPKAIAQMLDQLMGGFSWSSSPQGVEFWSRVHQALYTNLISLQAHHHDERSR